MNTPPCTNPVWSPTTDDELRAQTIAVLNRRNVIALAGGSPEMVAAWRTVAPARILPAVALRIGPVALPVAAIRELHAKGHIATCGVSSNPGSDRE